MRRSVRMVLAIGLLVAAAPEPSGGKHDGPAKGLEGVWTMRALEVNGAKIESSDGTPPVRLLVDGDKYTAKIGETVVEEGTLSIDAAKSPAAVDMAPSMGPRKGMVLPGIYLMRGDGLVICLAVPPAQRPTEFVARVADNRVVLVYKRG